VEVVQELVAVNTHRIMPRRDRLMRRGRDSLAVLLEQEAIVQVVVEVEVEAREEAEDVAGD